MKSRIFLIFLSALVLYGCKEDNSTGVKISDIADKTDIFKVSVDAIVQKDDNFALYYTTDGSVNFNKEQLIWVPVKQKSGKQNIVFVLPAKIVPSQVRIDFGSQPQEIVLKKVTMTYRGKALEIPGTLIFSYFRPDVKKTAFDATTGVIRGITVNGQNTSPSLYPKDGVQKKQIEKLLEP